MAGPKSCAIGNQAIRRLETAALGSAADGTVAEFARIPSKAVGILANSAKSGSLRRALSAIGYPRLFARQENPIIASD